MAQRPLIATFDLETTGFDPESCDIIEVGIIISELDEEVDRYSELINVGYSIPDRITEVTGIYDSDLQDKGLPWGEVRDRTKDLMSKVDYWCGYNIVSFDIPFLTHHIDINPKPPLDTYCMVQRFIQDDDLENRKLETLCHYYNVTLTQAHRAVYDAEATLELTLELMDDFNFSPEDWVNGRPVCLGRHHHGEDPFEALYSSRRTHRG